MESAFRKDLEMASLRMVARRAEAVRSVSRQIGLRLVPADEGARLMAIKAAAVAPTRCGPEIMPAPARGPMVAFAPVEMRRTDDGYEPQHVGFRGRDAARAADAFDVMTDQARRRGGEVPFTRAQIDTGRYYAALDEAHSSHGLKGVSVETMMVGRGGGAGGGAMEAALHQRATLDRMRAAIGDGWALEVTRKSKRSRVPLTVRELVDLVCLHGLTISEVLRQRGWAVYAETVIWARSVLAAALSRMSDVRQDGG